MINLPEANSQKAINGCPSNMPNRGSISILLDRMRADDETAIELLFNRYFDRLTSVAQKRVSVKDRKVVDDEDLALWAINTFQQSVRDGTYPMIQNRQDVWRFLVSILERKSIDHVRKQHAEKRGGGMVCGESIFEDHDRSRVIEKICAEQENFVVMVDFLDVLDAIVRRLKDPELGEIMAAKCAGHTVKEIAEQTGRSTTSINRKLRLVRRIISEDRDIEFASVTNNS